MHCLHIYSAARQLGIAGVIRPTYRSDVGLNSTFNRTGKGDLIRTVAQCSILLPYRVYTLGTSCLGKSY